MITKNLAINWVEATEGQLLGTPLRNKDEEAVVNMLELIMDNPDVAFEIILQIISLKPRKSVLSCLGAGPIEELLVKDPSYLEKLINTVTDTTSLKQCLQSVDYDDEDGLDVNLLESFLKSLP